MLSLCKPYLCIVKKKNISDLDCHSCAGAMKQYPESQLSEEETPSSLRRGHATVSGGVHIVRDRRKYRRVLSSLSLSWVDGVWHCVRLTHVRVPTIRIIEVWCDSVQRKIRRQARREVRTSGPALEGSIVSPLVNTMGGLSGGRRGGDVSGAASAPSLVVARLFARALALDLACGIRCPPFVIRKAYASDGSRTPRRKSSAMRWLCCSTRRAKRSLSLASASRASLLLVGGGLLARGRISSPLSAAAMLPPVLPRGGRWSGPGRTRCASTLPCPRLSCTASLCSTGRAIPTALARSSTRCSPSTVSELPRVLLPTPSSRPSCAGTLPTRTRKGDRVALERLRALLPACSWLRQRSRGRVDLPLPLLRPRFPCLEPGMSWTLWRSGLSVPPRWPETE